MKKNFTLFWIMLTLSLSSVALVSCGDNDNDDTPAATGKLTFTDGIDLLFVQGGTFTQGSDGLIKANEKPAHQVTLSDFYIGKFEITQKQWYDVVGAWPSIEPSSTEGKGDKYPVYYVTWNDAQEFIAKLNAKSGRHYRLPTEAEWEYASRGGNKSKNYEYSGSDTPGDIAGYYGTAGNSYPVDTYKPNELGLYSFSGNVYEWVSDWYGPYTAEAQTNPAGPASGTERVARGGTWINVPTGIRPATRYYYEPDALEKFIGLRIAHSEE